MLSKYMYKSKLEDLFLNKDKDVVYYIDVLNEGYWSYFLFNRIKRELKHKEYYLWEV